MVVKPPCGHYCPDRCTACHTTCQPWQEYEKAHRGELEARKYDDGHTAGRTRHYRQLAIDKKRGKLR